MDHFEYRDGVLYAEDVNLVDLAETVGTPFYCYSTATLRHHYGVLHNACTKAGLNDTLICYSVKANSNIGVIATLARLGAGADIVSLGELQRAMAAGIVPEKIVFSGVGKTDDEMAAGLEAGIRQFNVESLAELDQLAAVANRLGKTAQVALRVNPDVDAGTHEKISTGKAENKFGIAWEDARPLTLMRLGWPVLNHARLTFTLAVRSRILALSELHLKKLPICWRACAPKI